MDFPQTYFDHTGRPWTTEHELASGGEGTIASVREDVGLIAKLYRSPPSTQTAAKLKHMLALATPMLQSGMAWPRTTLHEQPGGSLAGFLMPRFEGLSIQQLYSPAQRRIHFPEADWQFLGQIAAQCARAFAQVHALSCVVGDVNQGNILVSSRGQVALIDCDSFQVQAGDRLFLCEVATPFFTPPELQQEKSFRMPRTVNHDRFGLAVLLFCLLLGGRHPFMGRYPEAKEIELEELIRTNRFAYGRFAPQLQIEPPMGAPPLNLLSPQLGDLFERAFARGSEAKNARPRPEDWVAALEAFQSQLGVCPKDPCHHIPGHWKECPWCRIEAQGGPRYFEGLAGRGIEFVPDKKRQDELQQVLLQLSNRALDLQPPETPSSALPTPLPEEVVHEIQQLWLLLGVSSIGGVLGLIGLCFKWYLALFGLLALLIFSGWAGIVLIRSTYRQERVLRHQAYLEAEIALQESNDHFQDRTESYASQKQALCAAITRCQKEWQTLPKSYDMDCRQLEQHKQEFALKAHLQSRLLADHKVPGIGDKRIQTLILYGIETAHDIEEQKVLEIKGFGKVLAGHLMVWKQRMREEFHFDPASEIPREERQKVALRYQHQQASLRTQIQAELKSLELLISRADHEVHDLRRALELCLRCLGQAQADYEHVTRAVVLTSPKGDSHQPDLRSSDPKTISSRRVEQKQRPEQEAGRRTEQQSQREQKKPERQQRDEEHRRQEENVSKYAEEQKRRQLEVKRQEESKRWRREQEGQRKPDNSSKGMNLQCPHCQKMLFCPSQYAGQAMRCPFCGGIFTVPAM
jgi:DNA-binding helix-hairpin-helix protein with protein kinase domain